MKFIVLQKNLAKSLSQISRIATSKTTLPILNNVLIEAEKNLLKLSTTNLEIGITSQIRAKIEKEGKITLPCQILTNFIDLIDEELIEVELEDSEVNFKSKNSFTKIKGISAEEFPIIPQIEKENCFKIKADILKTALDKVIFAVSPAETRIEISGVLFSFNSPEENFLTLVGTDSYRLAEKVVKLTDSNFKEKLNLIIPIKALQEFSRLPEEEKIVEIYSSENQILFVYESTELISRVINGEYPDYKQIIPSSFTTKIILEKESFLKAIKTVSLFSRTGINDVNLKFEAKNNKTIVSSLNTQLGQSEIRLESEIRGADNEIIFNYRYLLDGLLNISGDEVNLNIVNDRAPAVLSSPQDKEYIYLIMPIKK
ncbi:MAG: DNA polymerase III subunit beta [Patescibacteria group bacterium]